MDINKIISKIQKLLIGGASCNIDFKLNIHPTYEDIIHLWYYHMITNKLYRSMYERPSYNSNILKSIVKYRYYYTDNIKTLFEAHTSSDKSNLILFYIKDENKFIILLKDCDLLEQKSDPFVKIILPLSKIKNFNKNILNIDNNTVRTLLYT